MKLNDHSFYAETTSFGGNSIQTYDFEDRKWLKMSIFCLSLAIKAKLCIFHTANNMRLHATASQPGNFDYHNIAT